MKNKIKISKKTKFRELLEAKPEAAEKLLEKGMACIGCPMAQMETIEEGCLAHGFSEKEISELIKELNDN